MPLQNIADRWVDNCMTEMGQCAAAAIILPAWILAGELANRNTTFSTSAAREGRPGRPLHWREKSHLPATRWRCHLSRVLRLHNDDNVMQDLVEGFALFGERLAFGVLEPLVRRMPVEQGTVNTVFLQDECQFLAQGLFDLTGGPKPTSASKAWGEISNANGLKPTRNRGREMRQMN